MPKPKSGEVFVRELRITPPDGVPITDWRVNTDDFVKLIAAEEGGGTTGKKLHYHLYVEITRSETWLKKWIYNIAHCQNGESGNSVFFSRKPHDNTIGYVVKSGNIVCRHGVDQTYIDEWIKKSDEYVKNKSTERKREQRTKQSIYKCMMDEVEEDLKSGFIRGLADEVGGALTYRYYKYSTYPTRSQHEMMVIKLIHPYAEDYVRSYYNKSFHQY